MQPNRRRKLLEGLHVALVEAGWKPIKDEAKRTAPRTRTAPRARTSRRARRDRRASCASRSGGDPPGGEGDAEALLADLRASDGGRELFELSRAYFLNLRGWTYSRWHAALNALIEQERAFTYDEGGDDVWIVRRAAA